MEKPNTNCFILNKCLSKHHTWMKSEGANFLGWGGGWKDQTQKKNDSRLFLKMTCVADTIERIYACALLVLCGYFKTPEYFSRAFSQFISKFLRNYFVRSNFEPDLTSWSRALVDTLLLAFLVLPPIPDVESLSAGKQARYCCLWVHTRRLTLYNKF